MNKDTESEDTDDYYPDRPARPERTLGKGSGYLRGEMFWTRVTVSHGREIR